MERNDVTSVRLGLEFNLCVSKSDKIAKTKVQAYVDDIASELDVPDDLIFPFSSETKFNLETVWEVIEESLNS